MSCDCIKWAGQGPNSWGVHHHINCDKYKTENNPYLFYFDEGINRWIPSPKKINGIINIKEDLSTSDQITLKFKRMDMTDKQYNARFG